MSTSKAGKASGVKRKALAKLRQLQVLSAHERLEQQYQDQPYSNGALEELEKELDRLEQRRSILKALGQTLEPRLAHYESVVEVIEDPISHLLGRNARRGRRRLHSEKHNALLDEVVSGLLLDPQKKKKKKKTRALDDGRREALTRVLKALEIRSKRRKKRSG